jgi:molecular chaperone DnaK
MNDPVIGIDLGTTNSEVAVVKDGRITIVEVEGSQLVPSFVALNPREELIVGVEARNQYLAYPERSIRSIKRLMGSDEKVLLGESEYLPQEISAMIIKKLKLAAEDCLGRPVGRAVITVPAQFSDAQRQATRDAGEMAGLEVARIINEPTAACLAYENQRPDRAEKILAFDLGGGTFDVSIVEVEGEVIEVVASHGDNRLGGDDIDDLIADWAVRKIYAGQKSPSPLAPLALHRLKTAAETAKIRLSDYPHSLISEDHLLTESGAAEAIEATLDRGEFEEMIRPLVDKMLLAVYQALADAGLKASDLDEIVLVGGATRIPLIQNVLESELGRRPRRDVHPDLAVAFGAGVMAARLMGQTDHRVLVDITPYTFGTSSLGVVDGVYGPHLFVPIIKAGTPLPVSRAEPFATVCDGQEKVDVTVFQGENPDSRKNIFIGNFLVENLSPVPAGNEIILNMSLDLDGILRVTAVERSTGLTKEITIKDALAMLTDEQIARSKAMISRLFGEEIPGDEQEGEPAGESAPGLEEKRKALAGRVEELSGKMDETDRADAAGWLAELERSARAGDEREFERVAAELEDLIFYLEV